MKNIINKLKLLNLSAIIFLAVDLPVYASGVWGSAPTAPASYTATEDTVKDEVLSPLLIRLLDMVMALGGIVFVWGIVQFGLAVKDENADSKQRAMVLVVTGLLLLTIRAVLHAVGVIS